MNTQVSMKTRHTGVAAAVCAALSMGLAAESQAATVTDVYLFANWTSPSNASSPPFNFTGSATGAYRANLGSGNVISSFTPLGAAMSARIASALNYVSVPVGEVNAGETNPDIQEEVGSWDDAGIVDDGIPDELQNIDYNNFGATVRFNLGSLSSAPALIVAEDGGIDPFRLTVNGVTLVDGYTQGAVTPLTTGAGSLFSIADTSDPRNMDQAWLIMFSANDPLTGTIDIGDTGNGWNGGTGTARLEVDFAGVVPIPAALPLLFSALAGLGLFARRNVRA